MKQEKRFAPARIPSPFTVTRRTAASTSMSDWFNLWHGRPAREFSAKTKNMGKLPMPQKPLILFDGDCSFCRRWIDRWRFYARDQIEFQPYQQAADRFPQIPRQQLERAIHLVEPDGALSSGAGAVFRMLWLVGHHRWLFWLYDFLPGFAFLAERFYRLVAAHRDGFDKLDML